MRNHRIPRSMRPAAIASGIGLLLLAFLPACPGPGSDGGPLPDGSLPDSAIPDCGSLLADGQPCTDGEQCSSGLCLEQPGGAICSRLCSDEDECGAGLACALTEVDSEVLAACLPYGPDARPPDGVCSNDDDCQSRLCIEGLCREICTECAAGHICETTPVDRFGQTVEPGLCRWYFPAPDIELGPVPTSIAGSEELSFDVPPDVISFVIVAIDQTKMDDLWVRVVFKKLIAPDGTVLVDLTDGLPDLNKTRDYPGSTTVLVPGSDDPAAAIQAGTYRFTVGTYEPPWEVDIPVAGEVDRVAVIFERRGEEGGVVDLNLYFTPGSGFTAADAQGDPFMDEVLGTLDGMLRAKAHLALGEVNFVGDLPADYDVVEDDGLANRPICDGFATPGPNGGAVNIFFVGDITFTAGLSGGIPGPPGIYGNTSACIVAEFMGGATVSGLILAHEMGHFLGLFHPTEAYDGTVHDSVLDTPECSPGTPIQDCPDYTNLMFPFFPPTTDVTLSPGQVAIIRRNPTAYEIDRPAACAAADGVYDLSETGFATSNTAALSPIFEGSCGGAAAPERAHLYRLLADDLAALEIHVTGLDFAPLVHVRYDDCSDVVHEVGCVSGEANADVALPLDLPPAGGYFIFVDGRDGAGGTFTLAVEEVAP